MKQWTGCGSVHMGDLSMNRYAPLSLFLAARYPHIPGQAVLKHLRAQLEALPKKAFRTR
jgi:hypothetical protein